MSNSKPKNKPSTAYKCSRCGAKPGKPCIMVSGRNKGKKTQPHNSRIKQRYREYGGGTIRDEAGKLLPDGHTRRDADGHIPAQLPDVWRAAFLKATLRTGFCLALTQPMLEQLCAVATGFHWDRHVFRHSLGLAMPDNPTTLSALERRGLVRHRGTKILRGEDDERTMSEKSQRYRDEIFDAWELTPAGEKIVELLALTGVFVEPAAAADFKARKLEGK